MKAFRFLKDKWFYISLAIMLLLTVGVLWVTFKRLDKFTRHGQEFLVPDMVGMNYDTAIAHYQDILTFVLLDSVYVKDFPEGAVYQQNPAAGSKVKQGRNIYILRTTIAPEVVTMPNLRNLSLRQAMVSLNAVGLKVDKLEFVDYFARNAVVEQKLKGEIIEPKTDVVKGSAITLVVGLGRGDKNTNLPDLVGVNVVEAKSRINNASLNIGTEVFVDTDDDEFLFVSKMDPDYVTDKMVPLGSLVNVWYRSSKNFDFAWYNYEKFRRDSIAEYMRVRKFKQDTINYVIDSFNYILQHRSFSYDSLLRIEDMQMVFPRADRIDVLELDSLEYFDYDYEIDTTYFYDE
ncbi:MAG: PASTA domain-containing protein [Bacteroidales bacterium]|nr:PASTA domain-containing protein [Bacteroidales bacterium]MCR5037080.1 PASTA domain-containing protein [Bacteroidales bacterium]